PDEENIMTAITLDTLQLAQRLKKAGINETQAEAIVETFRDVQASADVATKQDLSVLKAELEARIVETQAEIANTKAELVRWVVSVGVLQTALIAALLMKLLPG
ncbi:MAG: CCDC90 family protein, partial [Candidatus Accumulibacter sp.]|nr:CCDC90 family protein [Accumulibacter sp.]